jgi:hypothetical protein
MATPAEIVAAGVKVLCEYRMSGELAENVARRVFTEMAATAGILHDLPAGLFFVGDEKAVA